MKYLTPWSRFVIFALISLILLPALRQEARGDASGPIISLDSGQISGVSEDGVDIYRGIPYARPPVGALRWRPPHPPVAWEGVRDASAFGHACPQLLEIYPPWADAHLEAVGRDEDCLTLNVWVPQEKKTSRLPVMVYIHGGNMQYGAGSLPVFDGRHLAREGVVLVTINYRVGYLGRFAHPALTRLQRGEPLANYGVFDQIAALEWVNRNIDAFGGDRNNVTIFGHSAGGVSVNVLMTTPQSKGLFHRAIAQGSGVLLDLTQHAFERGLPGPTGRSREDVGEDFAAFFEIEPGEDIDVVAALREIPWEPMVAYQKSKQVPFNPVVDGMVVVDHIAQVFERGEQHSVPYIGGANNWEWNQIDDIPLIGKWFLGGALLEGLSSKDLEIFNDQWTRIGVSQRWFAEGLFLSSTRYLAKQMANVGAPAWQYRVTFVQENIRGDVPGAAHGIEVPFIFGHLREHPEWQRPSLFSDRDLTEADHAWGDIIRGYWLNFARTGNPNGEGLPDWPAYLPGTDMTMVMGERYEPQSGLNKRTLDFLERRALIRRQQLATD